MIRQPLPSVTGAGMPSELVAEASLLKMVGRGATVLYAPVAVRLLMF
jgi:hypothetical protein